MMAATPSTRKLTTRSYDFLELDRIATSRRGVCVTDARPPPALTRRDLSQSRRRRLTASAACTEEVPPTPSSSTLCRPREMLKEIFGSRNRRARAPVNAFEAKPGLSTGGSGRLLRREAVVSSTPGSKNQPVKPVSSSQHVVG